MKKHSRLTDPPEAIKFNYPEIQPKNLREKKFLEICLAPQYAEAFDKDKIDPRLYNLILKITQRRFAEPNLWLGGDSGMGKTRAVHAAARAIYCQENLSVRIIDGVYFSEKSSLAARELYIEKFIAELCRPKLLIIDDWGKLTPKEPMALATHMLLEKRSDRTWVTTNLSWDVIKQSLTSWPHLLQSLLRRIRENFEVVFLK